MAPESGRRSHPAALAALVVGSLTGAALIARGLGLEAASGEIALATLGTLVIGLQLGWRQALLGATALAGLSIPAAFAQGHPPLATALIATTALGLGLSARRQRQPLYWLLVISLCLLIAEPLQTTPISWGDAARLSTGLLLSSGLSLLAQAVLLPSQPKEHPIRHSWRRCLGYGLLLACTTLVTTPFALQHHWHISGVWLILTPFLVLRPFVRDGWSVALHRSIGTLAGVLLVVLLAPVLPHNLPLVGPAILLAAITALIAARHGHPALMLMSLTGTIVLFNSTHGDLMAVAYHRILASGLGLAIALGVMALAHPIEQHFARQPRAATDPTQV